MVVFVLLLYVSILLAFLHWSEISPAQIFKFSEAPYENHISISEGILYGDHTSKGEEIVFELKIDSPNETFTKCSIPLTYSTYNTFDTDDPGHHSLEKHEDLYLSTWIFDNLNNIAVFIEIKNFKIQKMPCTMRLLQLKKTSIGNPIRLQNGLLHL